MDPLPPLEEEDDDDDEEEDDEEEDENFLREAEEGMADTDVGEGVGEDAG